MWAAWLCLGAAEAGSAGWHLTDEAWIVDEPVAIEEALGTLALDSGAVFRIRDDGGGDAGLVFVGEGTFTVRFAGRRPAAASANRLVALGGADPAELAPAVQAEALDVATDRGLVLSRSVFEALQPGLVRVDIGRTVVTTQGADGLEELVVLGYSLRAARRRAERTLGARTRWMRDHAFDPADLLALDELDADVRSDERMVAELHTPGWTWHGFATDQPTATQRWLAWVRDPSGVLDPTARAAVVARTSDGARRAVATEPFGTGAGGVPMPPGRVALAGAAATVQLLPSPSGGELWSASRATLRLQAQGRPTRVAVLDVPHVEQRAWGGNPPLPNAWELVEVSGPGGPVPFRHVPLDGPERDGRGAWRTIAVQLDEVLQPGAWVDLTLVWKDQHRYRHTVELASAGGQTQVFDLGTSTDLVRVLPRVRSSTAVAPVTLQTAVPERFAAHARVLASGTEARAWTRDGWSWTQAATTSAAPVVAAGRWTTKEPRDAPGVHVHSREGFGADEADLAAATQRVLDIYGQVLPHPAPSVDVVELAADLAADRATETGGGMVGIHRLATVGGFFGDDAELAERYPHAATWDLAESLHRLWWLDALLPASEPLVPAMMASAYATAVVGRVHGDDARAAWLQHARTQPGWEEDPIASPAFVLGRSLTSVAGVPAVEQATEALLDGTHPPTMDGLEAALQEGTSRDLSPWFDVWLRTGLRPDVDVRWAVEDGIVQGEARTDLAFGALPVPVRATGPDGDVDGALELVDGRAHLSLAWPHERPPRRVVVDPNETLLLGRVRSRRQVSGP